MRHPARLVGGLLRPLVRLADWANGTAGADPGEPLDARDYAAVQQTLAG